MKLNANLLSENRDTKYRFRRKWYFRRKRYIVRLHVELITDDRISHELSKNELVPTTQRRKKQKSPQKAAEEIRWGLAVCESKR
jgi:hypothetical protein